MSFPRRTKIWALGRSEIIEKPADDIAEKKKM
jgi:hypothetical protein